MAVPIITITTDFGTSDPYVAEMKGVILQINPQATIVDISHEVEAQSVVQGAFVMGSAFPYFPLGTVNVAVIDPGVGTSRRALLLVTPQGRFVGPDNGVLTYAVRDTPEYRRTSRNGLFLDASEVPVPTGCAAYAISNQDLWRHPVSDTFHGRDIFAPVAAHLSLGISSEQVGEPVRSLVCLNIPHPQWEGDALRGHVIHVDRFGNLVTTIDGGALPERGIEVRGHLIAGLSRSYADAPEVLAVIGSHGNLEIAVRNGNAARELGAAVGDEVVVAALS